LLPVGDLLAGRLIRRGMEGAAWADKHRRIKIPKKKESARRARAICHSHRKSTGGIHLITREGPGERGGEKTDDIFYKDIKNGGTCPVEQGGKEKGGFPVNNSYASKAQWKKTGGPRKSGCQQTGEVISRGFFL